MVLDAHVLGHNSRLCIRVKSYMRCRRRTARPYAASVRSELTSTWLPRPPRPFINSSVRIINLQSLIVDLLPRTHNWTSCSSKTLAPLPRHEATPSAQTSELWLVAIVFLLLYTLFEGHYSPVHSDQRDYFELVATHFRHCCQTSAQAQAHVS